MAPKAFQPRDAQPRRLRDTTQAARPRRLTPTRSVRRTGASSHPGSRISHDVRPRTTSSSTSPPEVTTTRRPLSRAAIPDGLSQPSALSSTRCAGIPAYSSPRTGPARALSPRIQRPVPLRPRPMPRQSRTGGPHTGTPLAVGHRLAPSARHPTRPAAWLSAHPAAGAAQTTAAPPTALHTLREARQGPIGSRFHTRPQDERGGRSGAPPRFCHHQPVTTAYPPVTPPGHRFERPGEP